MPLPAPPFVAAPAPVLEEVLPPVEESMPSDELVLPVPEEAPPAPPDLPPWEVPAPHRDKLDELVENAKQLDNFRIK